MSNERKRSLELVPPGRSWRVLAHSERGPVELENQGILDEIVVDDWLHLEQMNESQWWMRVGDARLWISIEGDGKARVNIERGCYDDIRGETKDISSG